MRRTARVVTALLLVAAVAGCGLATSDAAPARVAVKRTIVTDLDASDGQVCLVMKAGDVGDGELNNYSLAPFVVAPKPPGDPVALNDALANGVLMVGVDDSAAEHGGPYQAMVAVRRSWQQTKFESDPPLTASQSPRGEDWLFRLYEAPVIKWVAACAEMEPAIGVITG